MHIASRTLLAFSAGLVDTATFVHLDGLFAAHVTGNFVVFAAALARGLDPSDYTKLLTFPVFVLAVAAGTLVHGPSEARPALLQRLLGLELLLLAAGAGLAGGASVTLGTTELGAVDHAVAFLLVLAMGFQNAVHRFVPGPMSTVMTGNVSAFAAGLVGRFTVSRSGRRDAAGSARVSGLLIGGFAAGCLVGALGVLSLGLACVAAAAAALVTVVLRERARALPGEPHGLHEQNR